MKLRIALFILSVAAIAAIGLFTQAKAQAILWTAPSSSGEYQTTTGTLTAVGTVTKIPSTLEGMSMTQAATAGPCEEHEKREPAAEDDGYFTHKHWHRE